MSIRNPIKTLFSLILTVCVLTLFTGCGSGADAKVVTPREDITPPVVTPREDITPPVITLNGESSIIIVLGTEYVEFGAGADDNIDGWIGVSISGLIDTNTVGAYTITYSATDSSNNTNTATRSINIVVPKPFITTWKTDNPGTTEDNQIKISTSGSGYDYSVEWGDGTTDENVSGDVTHTYAEAGTYTVAINGKFPSLAFRRAYNTTDNPKILSIEQWGTINWRTMSHAFYGCYNLLLNAQDEPDLSRVSNMSYMFSGTTSFDSNVITSIGRWDLSAVTNMSYMFNDSSFNQDISGWNVSEVTDMSYMFRDSSFNQDISGWNVSAVTNMREMFRDSPFNQDISGWNVSAVTNMREMFSQSNFNQDISEWNVAAVTDMSFMFSASTFNQDISGWNVSAVTDMSEMFTSSSFNQDISGWNVSAVTNMRGMFSSSNFNQNIGGWDVSAVTNMSGMFSDSSFDQNIGGWDVSAVTKALVNLYGDHYGSMVGMFTGVTLSTDNYNALLLGWSIQNIQAGVRLDGGDSQYSDAYQSARDILTNTFSWKVYDDGSDFTIEVTDPTAFVANWHTSSNGRVSISTLGEGYNYQINWGDGSTDEDVTGDIAHSFSNPGTYTVSITGTFPQFYSDKERCDKGCDESNDYRLRSIEQWGEIQWRSMFSAFAASYLWPAPSINATDVPDLSLVTDMSYMFVGAGKFNSVLSNWDVSSVTNMSGMFSYADYFNQDISDWNVSSVTDMSGMFTSVTISTANYNALLIGWSSQDLQHNVIFNAGYSSYSNDSQASRDIIINSFNWNIYDEGLVLKWPN